MWVVSAECVTMPILDQEQTAMKRLLGLVFVLMMSDTVYAEKVLDYINESGRVYRNGYWTGKQFPLSKRYWFQTIKGGASPIFIDIPDVNVNNGLCFDGTAFKKHESGGLIMKCFNLNGDGATTKRLLYPTKDHHYFNPGFCNDSKKYNTDYLCAGRSLKLTFWHSMGDVGDRISQEECMAIHDKIKPYNFDFMCQ